MPHSAVWNSHPDGYGKGSRQWCATGMVLRGLAHLALMLLLFTLASMKCLPCRFLKSSAPAAEP